MSVQEYALAARASGLPTWRILVRHLLPNVILQAIVYAMSDIVLSNLAIVTLSYLGLGVPPPNPSWGAMTSEGYRSLQYAPHITVRNVVVAPDLQPLYDYLANRGSFVELDNYTPEYLPILSRDVLHRIAGADHTWESMVPPAVAELIKKRAFFGYLDRPVD